MTTLAFDPDRASPWHAGERAAQERAGVREMMEGIGARVMRPYMPEQHRDFFTQLPFLIVGSLDEAGQPWASVLAGTPGFISSPDPQHLRIAAAPLQGDPLAHNLRADAAVGLLGIEPHTRRRNRMNGIVEQVEEDAFGVRVVQSFGNCPRYIQARRPAYLGGMPPAGTIVRDSKLDARGREMLLRADTFFIATTFPGAGADRGRSGGADVSHRGGRPGFVRVDEDGTLTVPDFNGNQFFNTIGNLLVNPRAGLLLMDFDAADLLYLAVDAQVVWDGPEVEAFEGAEHLLRFKVREMQRSVGVLPLHFGSAVESPFLADTGTWTETRLGA
ncbi:MAG: pyridoxamine 5-phosphate oxidase-related, FMN-binding protein [Betaproteobacteria bacterium]|nr:pyridoxamine 5-phosphate oxidase-related, FMN-binding protein [Betaproteobacteria bacterium]